MTATIQQQMQFLTKGCVDVVPSEALEKKLQRSMESGKPLTIKVGFDPWARICTGVTQ